MDINAHIQGLDDEAFIKKVANQEKALGNKFSAIQDKFAENEYEGAINQLESIRALMDGIGIDWITNPTAQYHLMMKIDDIIAYIETL